MLGREAHVARRADDGAVAQDGELDAGAGLVLGERDLDPVLDVGRDHEPPDALVRRRGAQPVDVLRPERLERDEAPGEDGGDFLPHDPYVVRVSAGPASAGARSGRHAPRAETADDSGREQGEREGESGEDRKRQRPGAAIGLLRRERLERPRLRCAGPGRFRLPGGAVPQDGQHRAPDLVAGVAVEPDVSREVLKGLRVARRPVRAWIPPFVQSSRTWRQHGFAAAAAGEGPVASASAVATTRSGPKRLHRRHPRVRRCPENRSRNP